MHTSAEEEGDVEEDAFSRVISFSSHTHKHFRLCTLYIPQDELHFIKNIPYSGLFVCANNNTILP